MKIFIPILIVALAGCKSQEKVIRHAPGKEAITTATTQAGSHALVYRTKADYFKLVPVLMSVDKSQIVSYPDPADMLSGGRYPLPSRLHKGYMLDNRGIGLNVAFLRMTFSEYSKLDKPPTLKELNNLIIDKDPLLELIDCGLKSSFSDPVAQINKLIDSGKLKNSAIILK